MTYKTGTIHEFMTWTKQVVQDPAAGQDVPTQWFDSSETAIQSMTSQISAEAMVKLLSLREYCNVTGYKTIATHLC